jgi:pilus assembly protein CpaC
MTRAIKLTRSHRLAAIFSACLGLVALVLPLRADPPATQPADLPPGPIDIAVGQSQVIAAPWPVTHVAIAEPKIADVQVLNPQQVLVLGKAPGSTDLRLLGEDQHSWHRLIRVRSDFDSLRAQLKNLFPEMDAHFAQEGDTVAITGTLRTAEEAQQLHDFLTATGRKFVDLTRVAGPQQVLLRVRVAEADRTAIRSLGINAFQGGGSFFSASSVGGNPNNINIGAPAGASATHNPNIPFQFNNATSVNPAVTMLAGIPAADLQFFIEALSDNQYMRILAEPNLVALSGEEASFLVGGEYPIPVVQGNSGAGGTTTVTIYFKEYGVKLKFKPVVLGDGTIRLHVNPEISQLSDVGAVVLSGFSIPSLITRRADTTLQMKSGQTFAMAGLIDHTVIARAQNVPGLGSIPVLGALFRSVRYENDNTEMVVLTTVTLAEPLSATSLRPLPGELHQEPNDWELYGEGRIEGHQPHLPPPQAAWVRDQGLTELKGPGGWSAYDDPEPAPASAGGGNSAAATTH